MSEQQSSAASEELEARLALADELMLPGGTHPYLGARKRDMIVEALRERAQPQTVAEPSPCAYTGYVPHEGDEQVLVRIWGFGRPDASVKDVRVLYSFPPTTAPDERAIREAFDDWSWNKADGPIGGLDPISAARNGFAAGAKWGAERRAQADSSPQTASKLEALESCKGEQLKFEEWAAAEKYDMHEHPLHYLFMDDKTNAARQGWKAALRYATTAIAGTQSQAESAERPTAFLAWARETFGSVALVRGERLMRFAEEAIELAHADGMERSTLDAITDRVYSREPGTIKKEIGQAQACLEMYAENVGESADALAEIEWQRVQSIPQEEWDRRHAAKQALGIALSRPQRDPAACPSCGGTDSHTSGCAK